MVRRPKVSVVLTSYNHEKFLRESIESVLDQTFRDFELIIWDDASNDESWQIINSYSDPRIKAFRNSKNEVRGSINKAISGAAMGELVAILHSDDAWEPDKLEKQVAVLEERPDIGAVFSFALIIKENGELFTDQSHFYFDIFNQPNRTRYEWLSHFFFIGNALCHPSVLVRKSCYSECGLYRGTFYQLDDFDMWVRLCMKYEIFIIPEKLVHFRLLDNEENASGNRPDSRIRSQIEFLQILDNYRNIKDFRELIEIFPEAKKYYINGDGDPLFALGMIALEPNRNNLLHLFGIKLLFEALDDSNRAKKIFEIYNFRNKDFYTLTGENDVFSLEAVRNYSLKLAETQKLLSEANKKILEYNISKSWHFKRFLRKFIKLIRVKKR